MHAESLPGEAAVGVADAPMEVAPAEAVHAEPAPSEVLSAEVAASAGDAPMEAAPAEAVPSEAVSSDALPAEAAVGAGDAALAELCACSGCGADEARGLLERAGGCVQLALEDYFAQHEVFHIHCPYGDCQRLYEVRRSEFRCRMVRCGGNVSNGKFWQFPQHARRQDVLAWLESAWKGQAWPGWPGELHGCGRPFCFPEHPEVGTSNLGVFLTWDDWTKGTIEDVIAADPTGDYSRVV